MKRLLPLLAFAFVLAPAAAQAIGCSPLDCAPSAFGVADGSLLAVRGGMSDPVRVLDLATGRTRWRLPAGIAAGDILVHRDGRLVTWFDVAHGTRLRDATLETRGAFRLVGLSQGGEWAVLQRTEKRATTFVRLYDLTTNRLRARPLKDPDGSSIIWGIPFSRVASPNGRSLFTLYIGADGDSMVHLLDLAHATARCVALPGDGNFGAATTYALTVSRDGRTLWAVSPGYGRVVTIDVATHRIVDAFRFDAGRWDGYAAGMAALAADGRRIAVTDAQHIWLVDPTRHTVSAPIAHVAVGLGFAPDGRTPWVIGERSRVTALRP